MPTGGDGTAYYGEEVIDEKVMTKKDIKKRDEIADAISDKDMKDRYGDKSVKYAIATKIVMDKKKEKKKDIKEAVPLLAKVAASMIAKKVLSGEKRKKEKEETGPTTMVTKVVEELDKKDKPFVKKLVGKLRKGSKTHAKQADKLEKAMIDKKPYADYIVTQWLLDSQPIVDFISKQTIPVHVGITGPMKISSLIKFANIVGAKNSINFLKSNFSKALDLLKPKDPNDLIGKVKSHTDYFHIYTFGGLKETNKWLKENNYV